jgi:hypothetical protein
MLFCRSPYAIHGRRVDYDYDGATGLNGRRTARADRHTTLCPRTGTGTGTVLLAGENSRPQYPSIHNACLRFTYSPVSFCQRHVVLFRGPGISACQHYSTVVQYSTSKRHSVTLHWPIEWWNAEIYMSTRLNMIGKSNHHQWNECMQGRSKWRRGRSCAKRAAPLIQFTLHVVSN